LPAVALATGVPLLAGSDSHGPGLMLAAFVPMICIALGYRALNRIDPDCGTAFVWVTRAFGPGAGWVVGWAVIVSAVLAVAGSARWAGVYTVQLFGGAPGSRLDVSLVGAAWIALGTFVLWSGIDASARLQRALVAAELGALVAFAVVALVTVYTNPPQGAVHPAMS
jgi:amino acid transporter